MMMSTVQLLNLQHNESNTANIDDGFSMMWAVDGETFTIILLMEWPI